MPKLTVNSGIDFEFALIGPEEYVVQPNSHHELSYIPEDGIPHPTTGELIDKRPGYTIWTWGVTFFADFLQLTEVVLFPISGKGGLRFYGKITNPTSTPGSFRWRLTLVKVAP